MLDKILKFIFPHPCYSCGKLGEALCDSCKNYIIKQQKYDKNLAICPVVDAELRCFAWRRGKITKLIDEYKFNLRRELARPLAEFLASILRDLPKNAVLVSIPTTKKHNRQRGFDHMGLVVRELAKILSLKHQAILGRANQISQRQLARRERLKNAKKAFRLISPVDPKATYVVVDDVLTTGASLASACDLIKQAGAKRVIAVVICRQPNDKRLK